MPRKTEFKPYSTQICFSGDGENYRYIKIDQDGDMWISDAESGDERDHVNTVYIPVACVEALVDAIALIRKG